MDLTVDRARKEWGTKIRLELELGKRRRNSKQFSIRRNCRRLFQNEENIANQSLNLDENLRLRRFCLKKVVEFTGLYKTLQIITSGAIILLKG